MQMLDSSSSAENSVASPMHAPDTNTPHTNFSTDTLSTNNTQTDEELQVCALQKQHIKLHSPNLSLLRNSSSIVVNFPDDAASASPISLAEEITENYFPFDTESSNTQQIGDAITHPLSHKHTHKHTFSLPSERSREKRCTAAVRRASSAPSVTSSSLRQNHHTSVGRHISIAQFPISNQSFVTPNNTILNNNNNKNNNNIIKNDDENISNGIDISNSEHSMRKIAQTKAGESERKQQPQEQQQEEQHELDVSRDSLISFPARRQRMAEQNFSRLFAAKSFYNNSLANEEAHFKLANHAIRTLQSAIFTTILSRSKRDRLQSLSHRASSNQNLRGRHSERAATRNCFESPPPLFVLSPSSTLKYTTNNNNNDDDGDGGDDNINKNNSHNEEDDVTARSHLTVASSNQLRPPASPSSCLSGVVTPCDATPPPSSCSLTATPALCFCKQLFEQLCPVSLANIENSLAANFYHFSAPEKTELVNLARINHRIEWRKLMRREHGSAASQATRMLRNVLLDVLENSHTISELQPAHLQQRLEQHRQSSSTQSSSNQRRRDNNNRQENEEAFEDGERERGVAQHCHVCHSVFPALTRHLNVSQLSVNQSGSSNSQSDQAEGVQPDVQQFSSQPIRRDPAASHTAQSASLLAAPSFAQNVFLQQVLLEASALSSSSSGSNSTDLFQLYLTTLVPQPILPQKNRPGILREQAGRCAGCNVLVDSQCVKSMRFCEFYQRYFCCGCHTNRVFEVPAHMLFRWNFAPQPVSEHALHLLRRFQFQPVLQLHRFFLPPPFPSPPDAPPAASQSVSTIFSHPLNSLAIQTLLKTLELRFKLHLADLFMSTCRFDVSQSVQRIRQLPEHWYRCGQDYAGSADAAENARESVSGCGDGLTYSIGDLKLLGGVSGEAGGSGSGENELAARIRPVLLECARHITACPFCRAKGFVCMFCRKSRDVLFPFQISASAKSSPVHRCPRCHTCFHQTCFNKNKRKCPRCASRIRIHLANSPSRVESDSAAPSNT